VGVRLVRGRLGAAAAFRALERPGVGGIVVFSGRVRPDPDRRGRVVALDYEVDEHPAVDRLRAIEREARRRFALTDALLWHRVGRVPVGETAVVVGAASGHRAEAFAGARFLIDEVKATVPLWKQVRARSGRRPRSPRARPARRRAG
jgi:molybdopterin synthase catalytic subunit